MDKEKLKKYAGYAGLGTLGAYLSFLLGDIGLYRDLNNAEFNYLSPAPLIFGVVGGILGGVITKKWWRALVGGFILLGWLWVCLLLLAQVREECAYALMSGAVATKTHQDAF